MPKLSEMIESKYLRKEDLQNGDAVVTIVKIGKVNVAPEGDPVEMKWVSRVKEFQKLLVLNPTNLQLLAKACGSDDSDDWIGRTCVLYVDDNVSFGGKLVGGLRIRAHRQPPKDALQMATETAARASGGGMEAANRSLAAGLDDDIPF